MSPNFILEFDQFLRSIKISSSDTYTALLGAGASISSGIQSANDCIWEWKKEIYTTKTGDNRPFLDNHKSDFVQRHIQNWLDIQGIYPSLGDAVEYPFYAEHCYPIDRHRQNYFQKICSAKEPSIGYRLLSNLNSNGLLASVWTTNFDDLVTKAAYKQNVTPIEISLSNVLEISRPLSKCELPIIKLHGDYRFKDLKNTEEELLNQDVVFRENLIRYLVDKHLIVTGYSGRDKSLMDALKESYQTQGGGCLFWCGYGRDINQNVLELLKLARASGRVAYYIPTDGFDKLMMNLSLTLFKNDSKILKEIEEVQKSNKVDNYQEFVLQTSHYNSVVKSNLYEIKLPQEVFQFQINYNKDEKAWKIIKSLTEKVDVTAVPFKEFVWAFGTINDINKAFAGRIRGKINRNPNSELNIWKDSALYSLFLTALVKSLATKLGGFSNSKDLLWIDNSDFKQSFQIGGMHYLVNKAIELSIRYDGKKYYLALLPEMYINQEVTKEIRQAIGKAFFENMRNKEFDLYVEKWRSLIFNGISEQYLEIEYPLNSNLGFRYEIKKIPNYASVMKAGTNNGIDLIDAKFIDYTGIQFDEPKLMFSPNNVAMQTNPTHFHPMKGLIDNKPFDYDANNQITNNSIDLAVICPNEFSHELSIFLNKQNQAIKYVGKNTAYMLDYPGFVNSFGISLNVPLVNDPNWIESPKLIVKSTEVDTADELSRQILGCINKITNDGTNKVVIIFIPNIWNNFLSYSVGNKEFDLHDYIKAYCAERGIATQLIKENTIKNNGFDCQIHWWLALSYYVKSLRTPWILENIDRNTAFAGIGYSVKSGQRGNHIVLGCSHIYNWQGQGLKYKLSKVDDDKIIWDNQKNPHLNYGEAFNFGITIRDLFSSAMQGELPKRVVIHKQTFFRKEEIDGIKDSLYSFGVEKIDLIEVNYDSNIRFLASKQSKATNKLEIDGYAVNRGTAILTSPNSFLLWTHGVVPSIENPYFKFYLGGRHIPCPLRITKHYGDATVGQIANEILGLTKMNWNSLDLYTQLPATVYSSSEIARIGKLLSRKEGKSYDYRYFI